MSDHAGQYKVTHPDDLVRGRRYMLTVAATMGVCRLNARFVDMAVCACCNGLIVNFLLPGRGRAEIPWRAVLEIETRP